MLLAPHEVGYMAKKACTEETGSYASYIRGKSLIFEVYDNYAEGGDLKDPENFLIRPDHVHKFGFQNEIIWNFPYEPA